MVGVVFWGCEKLMFVYWICLVVVFWFGVVLLFDFLNFDFFVGRKGREKKKEERKKKKERKKKREKKKKKKKKKKKTGENVYSKISRFG